MIREEQEAQAIDDLLDTEARRFDQRNDVGGPVHATASVGEAREIQGGQLKTEGADLVPLSIPERLENVEGGRGLHGSCRAPENPQQIVLGETDQELAHPDRVEAARKGSGIVEQVHRIRVDASAQSPFGDRPLRHGEDLRLIHDRHPHVGRVLDAAKRPFTRVAADVEQRARWACEDPGQGIREGEVGEGGCIAAEPAACGPAPASSRGPRRWFLGVRTPRGARSAGAGGWSPPDSTGPGRDTGEPRPD